MTPKTSDGPRRSRWLRPALPTGSATHVVVGSEGLKVCADCGWIGGPRSRLKGSIGFEVLYWLLFLVPGVIYSIWRLTTRRDVCAACESDAIVSLDSPEGGEILEKRFRSSHRSFREGECRTCGSPLRPHAAVCPGASRRSGLLDETRLRRLRGSSIASLKGGGRSTSSLAPPGAKVKRAPAPGAAGRGRHRGTEAHGIRSRESRAEGRPLGAGCRVRPGGSPSPFRNHH